MIRLCTAFIAATLALAAPVNAQIPATDDPVTLARDYGYSESICDGATPRQRAQPNTDWSVNCRQAAEAKTHLKRIGYWCVTDAATDMGVPCTPALAKKSEAAPAAPTMAMPDIMTCQGILSAVRDSEDNFRVGQCLFSIDQYTGVVVDEKCRIGRPCTVQARIKKDDRGTWITHVYTAAGGRR